MNVIDILWAILVICALAQVAVIGTGVWLITVAFFEARKWWRKCND